MASGTSQHATAAEVDVGSSSRNASMKRCRGMGGSRNRALQAQAGTHQPDDVGLAGNDVGPHTRKFHAIKSIAIESQNIPRLTPKAPVEFGNFVWRL